MKGCQASGFTATKDNECSECRGCEASGLTTVWHLKKRSEPSKQPSQGGGQNLKG